MIVTKNHQDGSNKSIKSQPPNFCLFVQKKLVRPNVKDQATAKEAEGRAKPLIKDDTQKVTVVGRRRCVVVVAFVSGSTKGQRS